MTSDGGDEKSVFQVIEKMIADGRAKTQIGQLQSQMEASADSINVSINWLDPREAGDFVQFVMAELTSLRASVALLAKMVDDLYDASK